MQSIQRQISTFIVIQKTDTHIGKCNIQTALSTFIKSSSHYLHIHLTELKIKWPKFFTCESTNSTTIKMAQNKTHVVDSFLPILICAFAKFYLKLLSK